MARARSGDRTRFLPAAGTGWGPSTKGTGARDDSKSASESAWLRRQGTVDASASPSRQEVATSSPSSAPGVPFPSRPDLDVNEILAPGRLPAYRPSLEAPRRMSGQRRRGNASRGWRREAPPATARTPPSPPAPGSASDQRGSAPPFALYSDNRCLPRRADGGPRAVPVRSARAWRALLFGRYTRKAALACALALAAAVFLFGLVLLPGRGRRKDRAPSPRCR